MDIWNDFMGGGQGLWDSFAKHLGKVNLESSWPGGEIITKSTTGATPLSETSTSITGATPTLETAAITTL
jgi:hypothetical protein